jgi:hypothetical protein
VDSPQRRMRSCAGVKYEHTTPLPVMHRMAFWAGDELQVSSYGILDLEVLAAVAVS